MTKFKDESQSQSQPTPKTNTHPEPKAHSQPEKKPKTPTHPAAKTKPHPSSKPSQKPLKHKIYFTIFVIAWTILCTVASQLIVAYPLRALAGADIVQPGWTLLFYILSYAIAISLIIFIPPRLVQIYREHPQDPSKQSSAKSKHDDNVSVQSQQSQDVSTPVAGQELTSTPNSLGVQHLPTFVDIGLAPVSYVIYLFLAGVITSFMSQFTWFDAEQSQDVGFGYYITGLDRIYALIAIVFIAPIAEEIIMRGWLYGKLRRKWNIPIAMILVSLCFAILHGQWNVGASVFVLSLILCSLREITGTIWSGILLHILTNGIAFYLLYIVI